MKNKGVTLVELLIVVVVMGIIASFSVVAVQAVVDNTKKAAIYNDALAVAEAVTLYCADHIDDCTPREGRTWRGIRYSVIEEYLPDLDTDYYDVSRNIARVQANEFQNPQVRLRAQDNSDLSWYRWRAPKDEDYDRDEVIARNK